MRKKLIMINGIELPYPDKGFVFEKQFQLSIQENAYNEKIAQIIGNPLIGFPGLKWSYLDAETWRNAIISAEKIEGEITYYDLVKDDWITSIVYFTGYKHTPGKYDESGRIIVFYDCELVCEDSGKYVTS